MGIINVRHIYTNDKNEDNVEIVKFNEKPEEIFFIRTVHTDTHTKKCHERRYTRKNDIKYT